jgi:AAHS family benzoate transporter-like MFS transporter
MIFDGYDLVMYGTVVPSLLHHTNWHLSAAQAGQIASLGLAGMLLGALVAGTFTDIVGRRRILIGSVALFSAMMGLSALAPSAGVLAALRFVAGLGLGGVIPTASALTLEFVSARRRHAIFSIMWTGNTTGNLLAAAIATVVIPALGWQPMFLIGVLPLITLVPLILWRLPESPTYLWARGRRTEATEVARTYGLEPPTDGSDDTSAHSRGPAVVRDLFAKHYTLATVLFWMTMFLGLLLIYGMSTWLPELMRKSGYGLGPALTFLVVLDAGAIVGGVLASVLADRIGLRFITPLTYLAGAAAIAVLAARPSTGVIYLLLVFAGVGTIGSQFLLNAYVGLYYPARVRATALGWALGLGRIGAIVGPTLTGILIDSGAGVGVSFFFFAGAAGLACILISLVPRRPVAIPQPAPAEAGGVAVGQGAVEA